MQPLAQDAPTPPDTDAEVLAVPSLARPFAVFGAAAGLFAVLAIGSFRDAAREVSPFVPMILTAGVGAAAGEVLRRWRLLHGPLRSRESTILGVAAVTASAGAASGALIGLFTWGPAGVLRFMFGGACVALAFVPSCLVVFDAAKRAGRARLGSLVAATDARTVSSTVLAGVAFAAATQVPAVLSLETSTAFPPALQGILSVVVCLSATLGILLLQRHDLAARAVLEQHARDAAWLERASVDEAEIPAAETAVDLGLGAERWARTSDAHYRASGRSDVVLKGSVEQALLAFDEGARRRHRSLVVAACGSTAVAAALALRIGVML